MADVPLPKWAYRPIGLVLSLGAAAIAGRLVKEVWRRVRHTDELPGAMQSEYAIGEVVAAAALQALVFGVVHALLDRLGARAWQQLTGEWPGD
jgi:alcohol dehydrogenase class IV